MGKRTSAAGASAGEASKSKPTATPAIAMNNGFLAVPISLPHGVKHWIYVRKHTASSSGMASTSKSAVEEVPAERTLFVANLPVDTTEEHVREMFGRVGGVSAVRFRRQVGVEEEEEEREELGVGEDEEEHHQIAQKSGKKTKGKLERKPTVPRIVPLPPMDPRNAAGSQPLLTTASSAHIVFLDALSATRALDTLHKGLRFPSASTPTGLPLLLAQYTLARPPLPTIHTHTTSTIALYTYRKAHPLPRRAGVRGVTLGPDGELLDEDGFIIVQRSGKYGRAGASVEGGGSVGVARGGYVEREKKKSTGLEDFYRFQVRERKREELAGLRARFEKDRASVQRLKAGRRFRPY
ncbi:conserved hypothetical protein [Sporisorium reilianum SRZ2]|uniref:RRM domain-containing protein n=1 Tax=Sporisorium reilianum (strain SRZ2) TaxID=999809 RepID=E7A0D6_SPORE|nr:conserved hypothetical protein [Sporisorium reilianum SRZ2]